MNHSESTRTAVTVVQCWQWVKTEVEGLDVYGKSHTMQNMYWPIPGPISCAGVTGRWGLLWLYLTVRWLVLISTNVTRWEGGKSPFFSACLSARILNSWKADNIPLTVQDKECMHKVHSIILLYTHSVLHVFLDWPKTILTHISTAESDVSTVEEWCLSLPSKT